MVVLVRVVVKVVEIVVAVVMERVVVEAVVRLPSSLTFSTKLSISVPPSELFDPVNCNRCLHFFLLCVFFKTHFWILSRALKRDYNQNGTHPSGMWGC